MISPDKAARIAACNGIYSIGDTARHFRVSKSTVYNIWTGKTHKNVMSVEPANVRTSRVPSDILIEDGTTLLRRGKTVAQAADELGVAASTLYAHLNKAGVQTAWFF
jgi:transposase-like protein